MNIVTTLYGAPAFLRAPRRTAISLVVLLPLGLVLCLLAASTPSARLLHAELHQLPTPLLEKTPSSRVEGTFKIIEGGKGLFLVCLAAPPERRGRLTDYCPWARPVRSTHQINLLSLEGKQGYGFKRKGTTTLISLYQASSHPVITPEDYASQVSSTYARWVMLCIGGASCLGLSLLLQMSQLICSRKESHDDLNA